MITYHRTLPFNEPDLISEYQYNNFKILIESNLYADLVEFESYNDKFRHSLRLLILAAIGLFISICLFLITGSNNISMTLGVISMVLFFVGYIPLLLEGPSYSKFIDKGHLYFLRMKYAIIKSENYIDFHKIFYSVFCFDYDKDFKQWKRKYLKDLRNMNKNKTKDTLKERLLNFIRLYT